MFDITLNPNSPDLRKQLYDLMHEVMSEVQSDLKRENQLKPMLSRIELAEEIFNVSPQTLDTHIINKPGFPKLNIGTRVVFPRDEVLNWINKNSRETDQVAPLRSFRKTK